MMRVCSAYWHERYVVIDRGEELMIRVKSSLEFAVFVKRGEVRKALEL
jgi:hypothetical protein